LVVAVGAVPPPRLSQSKAITCPTGALPAPLVKVAVNVKGARL
jgi:hypothetical protein